MLKNQTLRVFRDKSLAVALLVGLFSTIPAQATWSVLAVDTQTKEMVVASATCVKQGIFKQLGVRDLRDIQAIVVSGKGVAVAQAMIDLTRKNQQLIAQELQKGTSPADILNELKKADSRIETRQFAIQDLAGRRVAFSGKENLSVYGDSSGTAKNTLHFQVIGNLLAKESVVSKATDAFVNSTGSISARVMAAMEAADGQGGDKRCTDGRTAHVAYLLIANTMREEIYLRTTDLDSQNPIAALRKKYDELSASSK